MTALVEGAIARGRARRGRRRAAWCVAMTALAVALFVVSLMVGNTFTPFGEVVRVILGDEAATASFTVGTLRLPRATMALAAGAAFGAGGVTFQTMLRNPLAAPDVIGISSGASAAAVIGLVVLNLSSSTVSLFAIVAALATAALIYTLSFKDGVVGTRLILIGIGLSAMLDSVTTYVLLRAASWDLQVAMRWLTGSLNGASWSAVAPLLLACAVGLPVLLARSSDLELLRLGDDAATALGVRTERTRLVAILTAVGLIAFATAAAGPIAFVAFLSGPIAARLVGAGRSLVLPAALVGSLLVLVGDLAGQYAFGSRYPVGVITGVLGAPYLVYLLVRSNRSGASL